MTDPSIAPLSRRRLALVVGVALCLVASACSHTTTDGAGTDASEPATSLETSSTAPAGAESSTIAWEQCFDNLECATLPVPLDWNEPEGDTIDLALVRDPSFKPEDRIGSLVMNPGGPGGSGFDFLTESRFPSEMASDLKKSFDLVTWDTRGLGRSEGLACEDTVDDGAFRALDSDPDNADEQAALEAASKAIADECAANDLTMLEHSTTTDTAKDLEAIRAALGEPKLNYMGFSYGTQIGQEYARLYPDKVRAMVLDGVVDPSVALQDVLAGQAAVIESTFSPATLALYDQLLAQAEQQPLVGPNGTVLTPGMITLSAIAASFYPHSDSTLQVAAKDALDGDADLIEQIAQSYIDSTYLVDYLAVSCTDTPIPAGVEAWNQFAQEMKAKAPRFGAAVANELLPCAFWPVPSTRQTNDIPIPGLPPILVVGTTGDPATPYGNAERVAAGIPGATLLTLDGFGHTAIGKSPCISKATITYLRKVEPPPAGTVCQQE